MTLKVSWVEQTTQKLQDNISSHEMGRNEVCALLDTELVYFLRLTQKAELLFDLSSPFLRQEPERC